MLRATVRCLVRSSHRSLSFQAEKFHFVDFRSLRETSEIQSALDAVGSNLSAAHIGAAFAQSQKLLPRPSPTFLAALAQRAVSHRDVLDVKAATIIFSSCAELAFFDHSLLDGVAQVVTEQIYLMDGHAAAKVIYALGRLHRAWTSHRGAPRRPIFPQMESLMQVLSQRLEFHLASGSMNLRSVRLLVVGLADLQFRDRQVLWHVGESLKRFSQWSCPDIVAVLLALGRLNLANVDLIHFLAHEATHPDRLKAFSNAEISAIIYSLCRLRLRGKNLIERIAREAAKPARLCQYTDHGLSNMVYGLSFVDAAPETFYSFVHEFLRNERLRTSSTRDIATLLQSLARRPLRGKDLMTSLAAAVADEERLMQFTPEEMATILQGFAQCTPYPATILMPLIFRLSKREVVDALTPFQLANVVYALGCFGMELDGALQGALQNSSTLKSMSLMSMTQLLLGLSMSTQKVEALNVICAREAMAPRRLALYSCKELTKIATSFARMQLRAHEFVAPLEETILHEGKFRKVMEERLLPLAVALADLRGTRSDCLVSLLQHLTQKEAVQNLAGEQLCALLQLVRRLEVTEEVPCEAVVNELLSRDREVFLHSHVCPVVNALNAVPSGRKRWRQILPLVKMELQQKPTMRLEERLDLFQGFVNNAQNLIHGTNELDLIVSGIHHSALPSCPHAFLMRLVCGLAQIKYRDIPLWTAICDALHTKVRKRDFKEENLILAAEAALEGCFELRLEHSLASMVESHLKLLHQTISQDSLFSIAPFVTSGMILAVMKLRAGEGQLKEGVFETCVDLLHALQTRDQALKHAVLAQVYPCFLYMQRLGYHPSTNNQSKLLRQSMEAYTDLESARDDLPPSDRVKEVLEHLENILGRELSGNAFLPELSRRVDVLDETTKKVLRFLESGRELDFHGQHETGEMYLERFLLETHGYNVHEYSLYFFSS